MSEPEDRALPETEADAFARDRAETELGGRVYLAVRQGDRSSLLELGDRDVVSFGRAPDSTVVVDDTRASRNHAVIRRAGASIEIEDRASRNGTKVNHRTLVGERAALRGGDVVWVGGCEIVVAAASPDRDRSAGAGSLDDEVIVADACMVELFEVARRVARAPTTVLVTGETGAGKEVVAELLHRASTRARGPFVRLNCASLPESLLESEVFGYERGAFTGASARKLGFFEAAHGGTLLLDEIGEVPLATQVKLLRVLENRTLTRVGGTSEIPIDVRVVCATHRDLAAEVAAGRFRQDLFYRLSAITLAVPPLRERPLEIVLLASLFAKRIAAAMNIAPPSIEPSAEAALLAHAWPGNVRELRNAIEHATVMANGAAIRADHLPPVVRASAAQPASSALKERLDDIERKNIEAALAHHGNNQTRAAEHLGISRRALVYKLTKYGLRK